MAVVWIACFGCNHAAMPSSTPFTDYTIINEEGNSILAGHCSGSVFKQYPQKEWFDISYGSYQPDTSILPALQPLLHNKIIEIFLGSWCGDSKREVPRMLKILGAASFDTTNLRLIFVDNSTKNYKQSPQREEKGKSVFRVPTFIVYDNNRETGRIIESPVESLEKDLLRILKKDNYIPAYKAVSYWQKNIKHAQQQLTDATLKIIADTIKPLCRHMGEFNAYGYILLAQKQYEEALNIFRLNTILYPADAGTFDSLGESYYVTGNMKAAKLNYQKVLELKPGDATAINMLGKIN